MARRAQSTFLTEAECRKQGDKLLSLLAGVPVFSETERPTRKFTPWAFDEPTKVRLTFAEQNRPLPIVPFEEQRALARSIQAEDVDALFFYGEDIKRAIGASEDNPIKISDAETIQVFLDALAHGEGSVDMPGMEPSFMQIRFRENAKSQRSPITLQFLPHHAEHCFGPRFQEALKHLGNRKAREVKQLVADKRAQITGIILARTILSSIGVPDAGEVKELLDALSQLDYRAFSCTASNTMRLHFYLNTDDGEPINIDLTIELDADLLPSVPHTLRKYIAEMEKL